MHTKIRTGLTTVGALALMLVPAAHALEGAYERTDTIQAINVALQEASAKQKSIMGVSAARAQGLRDLENAERTLSDIAREKRRIQMELDRKRQLAADVEKKYGIDTSDSEMLKSLYARQREQLAAFAKMYIRTQIHVHPRTTKFTSGLLPKLLGMSLGERIEQDLRYRALAKARLSLMALVDDVRDLPDAIAILEKQDEELIAAYNDTVGLHAAASDRVALSDAKLAEIKSIVAAVEANIRNMQSKLAEYDARIRDRAEKELIIKGLRAPREERESPLPSFMWPVTGRITAGYYESSYQRYFGVPHKAVDIAQPQASPVRAAEDGVVYHVQHGGAYGYSYILIGHRSGFATLYGHMFDIQVSKGQDITKGQTIGLSGGRPGTRGAGPMTTGPHLHFEVIRNGAHVNPLSVLP